MDELGEGDIDIIKAPIVIDNVSGTLDDDLNDHSNLHFLTGIGYHESRHGWRH